MIDFVKTLRLSLAAIVLLFTSCMHPADLAINATAGVLYYGVKTVVPPKGGSAQLNGEYIGAFDGVHCYELKSGLNYSVDWKVPWNVPRGAAVEVVWSKNTKVFREDHSYQSNGRHSYALPSEVKSQLGIAACGVWDVKVLVEGKEVATDEFRIVSRSFHDRLIKDAETLAILGSNRGAELLRMRAPFCFPF